jgi:hypothetical protein
MEPVENSILNILTRVDDVLGNFFDNLLGGKIEFNKKMNQFIESVKTIDWFSNCGKNYTKNIFYNYYLEGEEKSIKKLNYIRDYKGFVTLGNLLIQADRRLGSYLTKHHKKEHDWTWNKLADVINKQFANNFINIDNYFSNKFNTKKNNFIYRIFRNTLFELFFVDHIPNLPIFYDNIFEIFIDGHIIIGWEGKFNWNDFNEKPIEPIDGKLVIF